MRKIDSPTRRVLRVNAAAQYLSTSSRCIRELVQRGELALVRLSENERAPWLIDTRDLDNLVERKKATL
jgi:excisionase family DNA binding protein